MSINRIDAHFVGNVTKIAKIGLIIALLTLLFFSSFLPTAQAGSFFGYTTASDVGQFTSALVVDDVPMVAYYDVTNADLRFTACFNADCSNGTISTSPDTTGNVGKYVSMGQAIGNIIMSYYDETNGDLKFLACGNSQCSSGNIITTLDSTGNVGQSTSLVTNGTSIYVTYYDVTNADLKLLRCGNIVCNVNNTIRTIDSAGTVGEFSSIDMLGTSSPSIAYYDGTNSALKYARCSSSTCAAFASQVTLDNTAAVGKYPSLKVVNGLPFISYYDETNGNLKIIRCGTLNCDSGNTTFTVDSVGDVGRFSSAGVINNLPLVAYYDATNTRLKIVRCGAEACTSGNTFLTPDSATPSHGQYTSFYVEFDQAVISYYDATNTDMRAYLNLRPVVTRNSLNIVEGSAGNRIVPFNLSAKDDDPDASLTYTVTTPPTKGTLTLSTFTQTQIAAGSVKYSHTGAGNDFFNMTISDGLWTLNTGILNVTVSQPTVNVQTIGLWRPSARTYYLRNANSTGNADIEALFREHGNGVQPVVGDWDGDGVDSIGIFDSTKGQFYLLNTNGTSAPVIYIPILGTAGDLPVAGDWDGDGKSGIGVYRAGVFYLRNDVTTGGAADYTMSLGVPSDLPIAGDWNGDGIDSPGIYRPSSALFFLSDQICASCAATVNYTIGFGIVGDVAVAGDWNGDGRTGVGVFRPTNGLTYLKNDATTTGFADLNFVFGIPNDQPVAGHWVAGPLPILSVENPTPTELPLGDQPKQAPTFIPARR